MNHFVSSSEIAQLHLIIIHIFVKQAIHKHTQSHAFCLCLSLVPEFEEEKHHIFSNPQSREGVVFLNWLLINSGYINNTDSVS
jgi:hypothetical protein